MERLNQGLNYNTITEFCFLTIKKILYASINCHFIIFFIAEASVETMGKI